MLRNLFASGSSLAKTLTTGRSYLNTLMEKPYRLASVLALFLVPSAALGWWYYSVAMSVANLGPQSDITTSTEIITTETTEDPIKALDIKSSQSVSGESSNSSMSSSVNANDVTTDVTVNGQSIPVPEQGSVHKVIENGNGQTTVDISVESETSGTSQSQSSTNIQMNSSSDLRSETNRTREEEF